MQGGQQLAGQHGGGDAGHNGIIEPYALNNSPFSRFVPIRRSSADRARIRQLLSSLGPVNVELSASTSANTGHQSVISRNNGQITILIITVEHRKGERDKRPATATAIMQQQQRQQLASAGQHGGGDAGRRDALNNPPRATVLTSNAIHSLKRKLPSSFGVESVESWASTELEQETFDFLWTLKNYAALSAANEEIKSPIFRGGPKSLHSWQLKMNPKKKMDEQEYFGVHLILHGFDDNEEAPAPDGDLANRRLKVRFKLSLLDSDGRPRKQAGSSTMPVLEFKKYSIWGFEKFLTSTDLLEPVRRLVEEDTLKIYCRIWIEGELKHKSGVGGAVPDRLSEAEVKKQRYELLADNFRELLADTPFADVALSTETKTFMAHKAILAARSTVFRAMFHSNDMVKSESNTVDLNDFDAGVVKAMLEFIYTGETPSLNKKAFDLLRIAEKYGLEGLKTDCELAVAANLTMENCSEKLKLAQRHDATILKAIVINFMKGAALLCFDKAMDELSDKKQETNEKTEQ